MSGRARCRSTGDGGHAAEHGVTLLRRGYPAHVKVAGMRKRTIVISLSALAAAALAGGAYAATRSSSGPKVRHLAAGPRTVQVAMPSEQAIINDAARRLSVSPAKLIGALKGAIIDQINAAAAAG